jgi:hypothetical protein
MYVDCIGDLCFLRLALFLYLIKKEERDCLCILRNSFIL